ncbi:MAG: hypothetical protein ACRDOD_24085 [Streptosporangiaceae bacterium]
MTSTPSAAGGAGGRSPGPPEPDVIDTLTTVLVRACRKLAEAGQPQQAGRLAADAWVVLRAGHPLQARHLDGAMHHIARLEQAEQAEQAVHVPAQQPDARRA